MFKNQLFFYIGINMSNVTLKQNQPQVMDISSNILQFPKLSFSELLPVCLSENNHVKHGQVVKLTV